MSFLKKEDVKSVKWVIEKFKDGSYDFWLTDLALFAESYVSQYISQHGSSNTCAIFDIDETLLSSMPLLAKYGYEFSLQQQHDWFLEANCTLIEPIHKLYVYIESLNIPIYLITGRCETLEQATIVNLKNVGIEIDQTRLIHRPETMNNGAIFKQQTREKILLKHQILLNVGDQQADLVGTNAILDLKLPDIYQQLASDGFNQWEKR